MESKEAVDVTIICDAVIVTPGDHGRSHEQSLPGTCGAVLRRLGVEIERIKFTDSH